MPMAFPAGSRRRSTGWLPATGPHKLVDARAGRLPSGRDALEALTQAEGQTFVLSEPLSFWGGLDSAMAESSINGIRRRRSDVGPHSRHEGGRGSSSGSSVLAEAIRRKTGPAGIVLLTRDAIVTVGAMVAAELYGVHCPVVLVEEKDWAAIVSAGARSDISAAGTELMLTLSI